MAECKGCVKNVTCAERRFFGGNQKNCKDFQEKTYTLEELAKKICDSIPAEECDHCPATLYCRTGHNGMLDWLKKVLNGEP